MRPLSAVVKDVQLPLRRTALHFGMVSKLPNDHRCYVMLMLGPEQICIKDWMDALHIPIMAMPQAACARPSASVVIDSALSF